MNAMTTHYLICVPVVDLPEPYAPSSSTACGCPCGCRQLVWVADAQIFEVPAGTVALCHPCLDHLEPDPAAVLRALVEARLRLGEPS